VRSATASGGRNRERELRKKCRESRMDRLRPLPVGEKGSNAVGKNTESCKEIYRRSKRTMFLTENVSESTTFLTAKLTSAAGGR